MTVGATRDQRRGGEPHDDTAEGVNPTSATTAALRR